VRTMAGNIADQVNWWEQQRLEQLIRSAYAFEARGGRLRDFEETVEHDKIALPTEAQVKVLTIHGSKGLEYDAVFLPELDSDLTKSTSMLVTRRPQPCAAPDGVLRYMNSALQALLPPSWQLAFDTQKSNSLFEMLCVLYVAMTRARCALYLITHPSGKNHRQDSSSLLHSTLLDKTSAAKAASPETELFSLGAPQWHQAFNETALLGDSTNSALESDLSGQPTQPETLRIQLPSEPSLAPTRSMRVISDHKRSGTLSESVSMASAFSISQAVNNAHGNLIRRFFEQGQWLDDFAGLSRADLQAIAYQVLTPEQLRHLNLDDAIEEFQSLLKLSSVRAALSPSRYQGAIWGEIPERVEVENFRIVNVVLRNQLTELAVDRLVVMFSQGKPFAAEIIDIKADLIDPSMTLLWLDDRLDFYRPQLELCAQAIADQLQIPRQRVASYLLMLATDDLARVESKNERPDLHMHAATRHQNSLDQPTSNASAIIR
jgi:ATP-dependent helicase/nuclease subunit A